MKISRFIIDRLCQMAATLFLLSVLVFVIGRAVGNPLDIMVPLEVPAETREQIARAWGLDRPLHLQYVTYISHILRGDLGESLRSREPVSSLVAARLGPSLQLGFAAMLLTV